jgi:RNA polymerase sigma-54 factor
MAQRLEVSQTQKQTLKLTQSMQQSLMILQKNVVELADYLQEQTASNPLMEVNNNFEKDAVDFSRLANVEHFDLYASLNQQVDERNLDVIQRSILKKLILNINKNGYLQIDHDAFCVENNLHSESLNAVIRELQSMEPRGVGAESIRQCLLIQAEGDPKAPAKTEQLLQNHYHQFLNQDWPGLKAELTMTQPELNGVIDYLATLSLQPGNPEGEQVQRVVPDLIFSSAAGHHELRINVAGEFQLAFDDSSVAGISEHVDQDTLSYIRRGKRNVQNLRQALIQRNETLLNLGEQIVQKQFAYLCGKQDYVNHFTMTELAKKLKIDVSTVSRGLAGKYMRTDRGVIALTSLCSGRTTDTKLAPSGPVEQRLQQIVDGEDKHHPLSDVKIQTQLAAENIAVSRRLVTKMRDKLGIKSSTQRKIV